MPGPEGPQGPRGYNGTQGATGFLDPSLCTYDKDSKAISSAPNSSLITASKEDSVTVSKTTLTSSITLHYSQQTLLSQWSILLIIVLSLDSTIMILKLY